MTNYKLVIYVPLSYGDKIREALSKSGAGHVGNYDQCSFSTKGLGRFRGLDGTKPYIGKQGQVEMVEEERIETIVTSEKLGQVLSLVKTAHPYEEPVIDVYELVDVKSTLDKK